MDWLNQIEFWYWLIAAVILIIIEMLIPAAWCLWTGISAFIVGFLLYFIPAMPLMIQIIIFGILSIASLLLYKRYRKANPIIKSQTTLNRRGEQYIGRIFTLEEPIVNGIGKVKVDDSTWKVSGTDMPAGTKVSVISVNGTILNVETRTNFTDSNK